MADGSKIVLQQSRLAAEESRWNDILEITKNRDDIKSQPKILLYRLLAASKLANEEIVNDIVETAIGTKMDDAEAFALVRELGQAHFTDSAARLLLGKKEIRGHPHYQRAASRVLKGKLNLTVRRQLHAAITDVSKGGVLIKPKPSMVSFPTNGQNELNLGSIKIVRQSSTSSDHIERLNRDSEKFIRVIEGYNTPKVVEHTNVFINRFGQIWNDEGAIIRPLGQPVSTTDKSSVPNIPIAFNALSATRGIYHWLVDHTPPIACVAPFGPDGIPILLRSDAPQFERETLAYIGVDPERIIQVSDVIFVKRLLMSKPGIAALGKWHMFSTIIDPLLEGAADINAKQGIELPDRIYISRSSAKRRPLINEIEVETAATERGFQVFHFENLPLWQQIALVNNAKIIMAPHGAGLAHLIIASSGTRVIEILPIKHADSIYKLRWNYARLSLARGHRYVAWLEEQPAHSEAWSVDLAEFLPFLDVELIDSN